MTREHMEIERAALVVTLRSADPDAPTLCEGWTVRHLVAHLVQREHQPLRGGVDMVGGRPGGEEVFLSRLVERSHGEAGYERLVDTFAGGLPAWSPIGLPGDRAHLVEYVIHHEDVRRGGPEPAEPRVLDPDHVRALWDNLAPLASTALRGCPVGVVLAVPGGPRKVVRRKPDAVVLTGDPVELALHLTGRRDAADVEVDGLPDTVRLYEEWLER